MTWIQWLAKEFSILAFNNLFFPKIVFIQILNLHIFLASAVSYSIL